MKLHNILYLAGFASILISATQYFQNESSDKERDGLFVGHWAPTFFILGKIAKDKARLNRSLTE